MGASIRVDLASVAPATPYVFSKNNLAFRIGDVGQAQVNVEGLTVGTYSVFELLPNSNSEISVATGLTEADVTIVGERTVCDGFVLRFTDAIATEVNVVVTARGRNE